MAEATLPIAMAERLTPEDDAGLWNQVLNTVAEDVSVFVATAARRRLFAEVGACSHWQGPNQRRWLVAGGFAAPIGYGECAGVTATEIPGFDWSLTLKFEPERFSWSVPETPPIKRSGAVRITIPTRTVRHPQAAVHTLWPPGTLHRKNKRRVFYGFRKKDGVWTLVARSDDF